jgi:hypothetical protein
MPPGQFYTVFTLGFATAIGLLSILTGVALLYWPQPAAWASIAFGAPGRPLDWLSPVHFSIFVAIAGIAVSYWIVHIQQAFVRWSGDRLIARLTAEYKMTAQLHGSEYADEVLQRKAAAMLAADSNRMDLFGREEMQHAMAAAGVQISDKPKP